MKGFFLDRLSWPEAEALFAHDPVVLVPIGARLKQHGPHLPLNTDWVQAEYFTRRVVERIDVLALPTVQYGYYPAFVDYPGSTHLESETFFEMLQQICASLIRHGVRRFYALNMGISTIPSLEALQHSLADEGVLFGFSDPATLVLDTEDSLRQQPYGSHADELETSVMLAIDPTLVQRDKAPTELGAFKGRGPFRRREKNAAGLYSPSGIWGDARLASREKGAVLVDAMVEAFVEQIERLK